MNIGDELTVSILNLDDYGRGVAHANGYTIFVPDTLTDESVKIRINAMRSKLAEGEVVSFLSRSLKRIVPDCPYYQDCGGCALRHTSYAETLIFKKKKVIHAIYKFAHLDSSIVNDVVSLNNMNYRNKVEFQVNQQIGFYKKKSNKVVPVANCLLADYRINQILPHIKHPETLNSLTIRASKYTNDLMIIATGSIHADDLKELKPLATSIYLNGKDIYGNNIIYEKLGNYVYTISPESFFQVNTDMALKLYEGIKDSINPTKEDSILDLYCGTGTIGIFLAKDALKVHGIEINTEAIKDAKENANINNIDNITFEEGNVSRLLKNENFIPNKIVVDPPRSGLDADTIDYINKSNAELVIYVSCDPITLSRDLNLLSKYEVISITPYDMFPYTYHVECVCLLTRNK